MSSEAESPYAWLRLAASLALMTLGGAGMYIVTVALPLVQADFSVDRADASLPYTLTMIGFALGNIVLGRAVDRYGIARVLMASAVMLSAGFALSAWATSIIAVTSGASAYPSASRAMGRA